MNVCKNCHEEFGTGYGDLCCICYAYFKTMGSMIKENEK